jgi:hypothetical protein
MRNLCFGRPERDKLFCEQSSAHAHLFHSVEDPFLMDTIEDTAYLFIVFLEEYNRSSICSEVGCLHIKKMNKARIEGLKDLELT